MKINRLVWAFVGLVFLASLRLTSAEESQQPENIEPQQQKLISEKSSIPQDKLIEEGIALHDQGEYGKAISKYQEALMENPQNTQAMYELAFSYMAKRDFKQCQTIAENGLKLQSQFRPFLYSAAGNCLDAQKQTQKAIETYEQGLKEHPDDWLLNFNLAVSLTSQQKYGEARKLAKRAVTIDPTRPSGHYLLGQVFLFERYRVPAILAFLRFLSLEPYTQRSRVAARAIMEMMKWGIQKSEKDFLVGPDIREDEDDHSLDLLFTLISTTLMAKEEKENKESSEIERIRKIINGLSSYLSEVIEMKENGTTFIWDTYVPFFAQLKTNDLVEPFTYVCFFTASLPGTKEWLDHNPEKVKRLADWLRQNGARRERKLYGAGDR